MNGNIYIVTGVNGHLGNTVARKLLSTGNNEVRGLILPGEVRKLDGVHYFEGDVRDKDSLRPLFEGAMGADMYVIHTAGIVDVGDSLDSRMYDVNVKGTGNIIDLCFEYGVKRLVYVSSVHAIPDFDHMRVLTEVDSFSPELVDGGYAKTKAAASQSVIEAVGKGLDAVIVQPSGIIGPYGSGDNYLVKMISDYITGKLGACVRGGYDFVDVRDVADGCLSALKNGRRGECYILSNRYYEIYDILNMARRVCKVRRALMLPMWMAKLAEPFIALVAKLRRKKPLYTKYSLKTLESNDKFSHDKATKELGYYPRDLFRTVKDTVYWLVKSQKNKKIKLRG